MKWIFSKYFGIYGPQIPRNTKYYEVLKCHFYGKGKRRVHAMISLLPKLFASGSDNLHHLARNPSCIPAQKNK